MKKISNLKGEVKELSLLFEVSEILERSVDLKDVLAPVLDLVAHYMNIVRGTLCLINRKTGEISTEVAYGLSSREKARGRYKVGEGITGQVFKSGRPAIVPKVSEEPLFLDKTKARRKNKDEEVSFMCVPIKLEKEIIGALSVDKLYAINNNLEDDVRVLSIVASMIARAVKLRQTIQEEKERLLKENTRLQAELQSRYRPENIIGNSNVMHVVYGQISQVSKSSASVLILGESGTGKELVASAIHYNSLRAKAPFVKVSCAALTETILESELFGHEAGAFTGATKQKKGRFELADGGTIFLDEIGDISPQIQIKLLRVLQEKEFERVGGLKTIKVNVRLIAATNRDLNKLIEEGKFREDLYYRLNVFPIHLPPLRERKTDILLLANYFVEKYAKLNHKKISRISTPAIDMLMSYHWPGNVRELENCIERAVIVSEDEVIHGHHLPPTLQTAEFSGTKSYQTLPEALDNLEREMILEALKTTRGNKAKAARALGISERLMGIRVNKHNIDFKRFK